MKYILQNISSDNLYLNSNTLSFSYLKNNERNKDTSKLAEQTHNSLNGSTLIYNSESHFGKTSYKKKLSRLFRTSKPNKYFSKKRELKPVIVNVQQIKFGTENGFFFELLLVGLGFKVVRSKRTNMLQFELHFSHKFCFTIPKEVNVRCIKKKLVIFGIDKPKLVSIVEKIKAFRFPNTYKGKGIKYFDEILKLKPGKQR